MAKEEGHSDWYKSVAGGERPYKRIGMLLFLLLLNLYFTTLRARGRGTHVGIHRRVINNETRMIYTCYWQIKDFVYERLKVGRQTVEV